MERREAVRPVAGDRIVDTQDVEGQRIQHRLGEQDPVAVRTGGLPVHQTPVRAGKIAMLKLRSSVNRTAVEARHAARIIDERHDDAPLKALAAGLCENAPPRERRPLRITHKLRKTPSA